jgi:hypothetical protein
MSKSKVFKRYQSAKVQGAFAEVPARNQVVKEAKQIPLLEDQLSRLTGAAENVETQANRLHELADRLFGVEGQEGKAGEPIPSPLSSIGKLNDAHERLGHARASLAAAVNRLEAL